MNVPDVEEDTTPMTKSEELVADVANLRATFGQDHAPNFPELASNLYDGDGSMGINGLLSARIDGEIGFLSEILRIVALYGVGQGSPEGQAMRAALVVWANELQKVTNAAQGIDNKGGGRPLYSVTSKEGVYFLPPDWGYWLGLI